MNPTDHAFPVTYVSDKRIIGTGMDLRTYMATAFMASFASRVELLDGVLRCAITDENMKIDVNNAVAYADALIERLNAK